MFRLSVGIGHQLFSIKMKSDQLGKFHKIAFSNVLVNFQSSKFFGTREH